MKQNQSQNQERTNSAAFTYRRKLWLQHPPKSAGTLIDMLKQLSGMATVQLQRERQLQLTYNTSQLQIAQILSAVENTGATVNRNRWQRVRLAWYQFVDANAKQNAERTDVHCCNKPPTIGRKRQ